MSAAVPDVFYLDDPQDGASQYLLSSLGVTLLRSIDHQTHQIPTNEYVQDHTISTYVANNTLAINGEHNLPYDIIYVATNGSSIVDIRDSGDAWIRIILNNYDSLLVKSKVYRRIG